MRIKMMNVKYSHTQVYRYDDANTQANEIRKGEYYAPFMHRSTLTIVE